MPLTGGTPSASASGSANTNRPLFLEPPPVPASAHVNANASTLPPTATTGSKRSWSASASVSSGSATPTAASSPTTNGGSMQGHGSVTPTAAAVSGASGGAADGTQVQPELVQGQQGDNTTNIIIIGGDEAAEDEEGNGQPPAKRIKKNTSDVWRYFTKKTKIIEDNGKTYEQLWGHCNFPGCRRKYRAESNYGTTGFWTHLKSAHSVVKSQQQLKVERDHGSNLTAIEPYRYDEEASLKKFYLAIIMHEYPFNISEHEYFVEFIKSLRPTFPIKSRVTIRKEIMNMFLKEKEKLYGYFKTVQCRFSATMDMWTSNQNKSYMCVTVHWIDDDWCIQKRIVNFFHVEGRHTGARLSEIFTEVMVKWYIDKRLFSLTLDNAAANEVAVKDIIADLKVTGNASLVCDGLFFHVRCACHILNLVARDGLSVIAHTIENIRALVLAVKGSPLQWEELMKRATECGLDTTKGLSLDVSTRWNSTYLMLRDALYYKAAFVRLKSSDRRRYEKISPSPSEWAKVCKLFQCLKKFYGLTELLSGTLYPTANLFYRGFCEIKILLDDWSISTDLTISEMASSMSKKFEKYWKKSSTTLDVACFLDPRYKKRLVEFYLKKFHGSGYQVHLDKFDEVLKKLYQFYVTSAQSSSQAKSRPDQPKETDDISDLLVENEDDELENFLYDTRGADVDNLNDLDKYMADPPLRLAGKFDILSWWKNQKDEYPVLSQIARDLLAVQVSTVASESAFSAGGRVIDPFRSRLDLEMVEALICTKDWVTASRTNKKVGSIVGDLEVLEVIASKLAHEEEKVADSDEEVDGPHTKDLDIEFNLENI